MTFLFQDDDGFYLAVSSGVAVVRCRRDLRRGELDEAVDARRLPVGQPRVERLELLANRGLTATNT